MPALIVSTTLSVSGSIEYPKPALISVLPPGDCAMTSPSGRSLAALRTRAVRRPYVASRATASARLMPVTFGINSVACSAPPLTAKLTGSMPGIASLPSAGYCPSTVPIGCGERVYITSPTVRPSSPMAVMTCASPSPTKLGSSTPSTAPEILPRLTRTVTSLPATRRAPGAGSVIIT